MLAEFTIFGRTERRLDRELRRCLFLAGVSAGTAAALAAGVASAAGGIASAASGSGGGGGGGATAQNPMLTELQNKGLQKQQDLLGKVEGRTTALDSDVAPIKQWTDTAGNEVNKLISNNNDLWNEYKAYFQPLREGMAKEAQTYGSKELQDERAAEAGADVAGAAEGQRQAMTRNLQARGVNPNSGNYQAALAQMGLGEAAANAGAQTLARRQERDSALGKKMAVMSLNPMPNFAQSAGAALGVGGGYNSVLNAKLGINNQLLDVANSYGNASGNATQANQAGVSMGIAGNEMANRNAILNAQGMAPWIDMAKQGVSGVYNWAKAPSDKNTTGNVPLDSSGLKLDYSLRNPA